MSSQIVTYACGTPIRQKLMFSIAKGFESNLFNPFSAPDYLGGTAIVWGLIRGAKELMEKAASAEETFYQIDNGYFGRNHYFRISKNAVQKTQIRITSKARSARVLASCGITLPKGHTENKGSKILIALSSEYLFAFHGQTSRQWLTSTVESITQFSDREIEIRSKNSSKPLAQDLDEAWCVVTHSSAVALDALQRNIPVICTSECAASPLSMRFADIESPKINGSVEELLLSLAGSQFTPEEYANSMARESVLMLQTKAEPQ